MLQPVLGGHTERQLAELCQHSQGHFAAATDWCHEWVRHLHVPTLWEKTAGASAILFIIIFVFVVSLCVWVSVRACVRACVWKTSKTLIFSIDLYAYLHLYTWSHTDCLVIIETDLKHSSDNRVYLNKSANKGVNWCLKNVSQTQQQRLQSLMEVLTWHVSKCKGHKLHQRYKEAHWASFCFRFWTNACEGICSVNFSGMFLFYRL